MYRVVMPALIALSSSAFAADAVLAMSVPTRPYFNLAIRSSDPTNPSIESVGRSPRDAVFVSADGGHFAAPRTATTCSNVQCASPQMPCV